MKYNNRSYLTEVGFTLIEVVMAITVSIVVTSVIYTSLSQVMSLKVLLDDERELGMVSNSVLDRLTRELQLITADSGKLLPPKNNLSQTYSDNVDLIGESASLPNGESGDSITFIAKDGGQYVHDGITHTGAIQITYRVAEDPENSAGKEDASYYLIRDETPLTRKYDTAYDKTMTFPVTSRLVSLRFRYFDADEEVWSDKWDEKKYKLPRLIQFKLKLRAPSGRIKSFATTIPIGQSSL